MRWTTGRTCKASGTWDICGLINGVISFGLSTLAPQGLWESQRLNEFISLWLHDMRQTQVPCSSRGSYKQACAKYSQFLRYSMNKFLCTALYRRCGELWLLHHCFRPAAVYMICLFYGGAISISKVHAAESKDITACSRWDRSKYTLFVQIDYAWLCDWTSSDSLLGFLLPYIRICPLEVPQVG